MSSEKGKELTESLVRHCRAPAYTLPNFELDLSNFRELARNNCDAFLYEPSWIIQCFNTKTAKSLGDIAHLLANHFKSTLGKSDKKMTNWAFIG